MKTNTKIALGVVAVVAVTAVFYANTNLFKGSIGDLPPKSDRLPRGKISTGVTLPAAIDIPRILAPRAGGPIGDCVAEILYNGTQDFDTVFENLRRELTTSRCNYRFALTYKADYINPDNLRNAIRCTASQTEAVIYAPDNAAEKGLVCSNDPRGDDLSPFSRIEVLRYRGGPSAEVEGRFYFFPHRSSSLISMYLRNNRRDNIRIERIADGDNGI